MRRLALILALGWLLSLVAAAFATEPPATPPEIPGYRMSDYRTPTPAALDGKPALTTAETHDLWVRKAAVFIDAKPHAPKPANLAPGTLWRDKPRLDIPGSIWLPDTGYGALASVTEDYFRRGLKEATGGDKDKPLVFYCSRNCWMSWNAAKRAKTFGYTHVLWYPDGTEGWSEAGYPLKELQPFPRP
ncbi:MAG: PQQ-dependent catabolism-associated CXXCW motif protein [Xanthobacteraceae bacterium]